MAVLLHDLLPGVDPRPAAPAAERRGLDLLAPGIAALAGGLYAATAYGPFLTAAVLAASAAVIRYRDKHPAGASHE